MMNRLFKLTDSLLEIPGIGPTTYLKMSQKGLISVGDLIRLYPIRYEDFTREARIASLEAEEKVTLIGRVLRAKNDYTRKRGFTIQRILIKDATGELEITWFNQPFIIRSFKEGETYRFSGKVVSFRNKVTLMVQEFEPESAPKVNTGVIVPYYSETFGMSSKLIRQKLKFIIANLNYSEVKTLKKFSQADWLSPNEAILFIHFPKNSKQLELARNHYLLIELLKVKLSHFKDQAKIRERGYPLLETIPTTDNQFIQDLPFKLTPSQARVIKEINSDFETKKHLNRLLMGDVGSGKTVILSYLCYLMIQNQQKTILLVPTEALAQQHLVTLRKFLAFTKAEVGMLTASAKEYSLTTQVFIGTQALFYKKAELPKAGLLIIDEQHKFGVNERERLFNSKGQLPHLLTVSATPIPRSLAQSLYGQVDTSYLTERPFEQNVKTWLVPESKRTASYDWVEKTIKEKKIQAFVICAAIESKEQTSSVEIKAVKDEEKKLKALFPNFRIAAVYSRHPEKQQLLDRFRNKELDILISTSLIEVGIDIPEANLMIIENAERFGLSQLHQMRGRIGRRDQEAYCLLFTSNQNPETLTRLKVLENHTDALQIAKKDLELRGPGNLLGLEQHGFSFVTLSDLLNPKLLAKVDNLIKELLAKYPTLDYTSLVKYI